MSTNYDNIPEELRALRQWVCFKKVLNKKTRRIEKQPRDPRNGYAAKPNGRNTWTDYDTAVKGVSKWNLDGIGFMFADGYFGIDLDHVLENGQIIDPAAADIFKNVESYTEVSPSGTGLHIICKAHIEIGSGENHVGNFEMYQEKRFFTVTGDVYQGRTKINECNASVFAMHKKYMSDPQKAKKKERQERFGQKTVASSGSAPVTVTDSDDDIIRKASEAKNGGLFRQLWSGDWAGAGYPSQSEADMAFVKLLAYWTNGDVQRMDSLYRQSGLMRDKWDRRQSGSTYGAITIGNALQTFTPYTGPERKTAAEAFASDPAAAFSGAVATFAGMPSSENPHPDSALDYLKGQFEDDIRKFMSYKDRKTGFPNLDEECTGLYPGLYVIGAISSLGKTTFCCQMMDQLAAAGEKCIYFSLEQSSAEMISKSVSRITALNELKDPTNGLNRSLNTIKKAVSAINIRRGQITDEVKVAVRDYAKIAGNIDLVDCGFGATVEYVKKYVEAYIEATGEKPVIFVDYLQVLQSENQKLSKQERMDSIVTALKVLQKENDLVIIVISSLNRQNYLAPVDFESFKESGGIEYTADVVWGLQLQIMRSQEMFEKEKDIIKKRKAIIEAKKAIPRKIELTCLKNRYGISSYSVAFQYDPRFDIFVPDYVFESVEKKETPYDGEQNKKPKFSKII